MKHPIYLLLIFLALFSCQNSQSNEGGQMFAQAKEAYQDDGDQAPPSETRAEEVAVERKLIKRGEIEFETQKLGETRQRVEAAVQAYKGYLSSDNQYSYPGRIEQRLEIRVPADHFDSLLARIAEGADHIDRRSVNVQDVTEEYLDVETRIRTKKALEQRYTELLSQAKTVEDLLAIERQLGEVRTEIESAEGRLKYLADQVGYSTLTVTFYEKTSEAPGFARHFGSGIQNGWENLLWFFVGLINIWPFLILGAVAIWLLRRWWKRRK